MKKLIILILVLFIAISGVFFSLGYYSASIITALWAIVLAILYSSVCIISVLKEQREDSIVERIEEVMKKQEEIM